MSGKTIVKVKKMNKRIFHKNVMFIKTKVIKLMSCSSKLKKIEQSMVRHE